MLFGEDKYHSDALTIIGLSFLVILSIDDFTADLGEKLINRVDVLVRWGFNCKLAVGHVLLEVLCKDCGYGSVCGQITLASNDNNEHLLILALEVLIPFTELVKRLLIIDGVTENSNAGIGEEEVSKVMNGGVTSCIPNIQLHFLVVYLNELGVVLNHIGSGHSFTFLRVSLHERANDWGLANIGVAHENNLRVLNTSA